MKRTWLLPTVGIMMIFGAVSLLPLVLAGSAFLLENLSPALSDAGILIFVVINVGLVVMLIAGIGLVVGSALLPFRKAMARQTEIMSRGIAAEAKILAIAETGTIINNNPLVRFTLEIFGSGQPAFIAESRQTVSVLHLPSYQPGKYVNVKYIPGTTDVLIIGMRGGT